MTNVNITKVKERENDFITKASIDSGEELVYLIFKKKGLVINNSTDLANQIIIRKGINSSLWQTGNDRTDLIGEVSI